MPIKHVQNSYRSLQIRSGLLQQKDKKFPISLQNRNSLSADLQYSVNQPDFSMQ